MARFSPIEVQPGMDQDTMAQIINNNFRQVAESNRTNIITDEDGVNRVLIGKGPKGNYVLAVTKKTIDVVKALEK